MKPLSTMTPTELSIFVAKRRELRGITPNRRPKRKTIAQLSFAWNIPEAAVTAAATAILNSKGDSHEPERTDTDKTD